MSYTLKFFFSDNTNIEIPFITNGAKLTKNLYSELKHCDDVFQAQVIFDETLADKIKNDINRDIKVVVKNNNNLFFTGYLRKTVNFVKTQKNQPFSIEIVDPALLLDVNYKGNQVHFENVLVSNLIGNLLSQTNFSGEINVSALGNESIPIFVLNEGDNIKSIIDDVLFNFGYSYWFDAAGALKVVEMFEEEPSEYTNHLDGSNCMNEIRQTVKERQYKNIVIRWESVIKDSNVLIFEDTTGANSNSKANIKIDANSYYINNEVNRLEYDSKYQEIKWIKSANASITYDNQSGITQRFINLGTEGELTIYNSNNHEVNITQLEVNGSGYFVQATNLQNSPETVGSKKEFTCKYITKERDADYLCKKIADYYKYSNFTTTVWSHAFFTIGAFVDVSDNEIGTVKTKVIRRIYNFENNCYEYTLESITSYDPVELTSRSQLMKSNSDSGNVVRSAIAELKDKVDAISIDSMNCGMSVNAVTIELDTEGKTIIPIDFSTTIFLRQDSEDVDFSIGTMALPNGWTYEIEGKTINFHIGEAVDMKTGNFIIPVQYRTIVEDNIYVDENGDVYEDENGNVYHEIIMSDSYTQFPLTFFYLCNSVSHYFGTIYSLDDLPVAPNIGDYFVWGGDNTPSALSYDTEFKKARTYKYIGEAKNWKYEEDKEHYDNNVIGDVLAIANADLASNNATVYEYLEHLTANSVFTDLLIANQAIVVSLYAKLVQAGIVTADDIFVNGKIKANLIDTDAIKATSGFFDNITISGNAKIYGELNGQLSPGDILFRNLGSMSFTKNSKLKSTCIYGKGKIKLSFDIEAWDNNHHAYTGRYPSYPYFSVQLVRYINGNFSYTEVLQGAIPADTVVRHYEHEIEIPEECGICIVEHGVEYRIDQDNFLWLYTKITNIKISVGSTQGILAWIGDTKVYDEVTCPIR